MGVFFILCLCRINYRRGQTIYGPNASVCLPSQTLAQGRSLGPVTQNYISSFMFSNTFWAFARKSSAADLSAWTFETPETSAIYQPVPVVIVVDT